MRSSVIVSVAVVALCVGISGSRAQYAPQYSSDPCDPTYAGYRVNQTTAYLAQQACIRERQQQQQAQTEQQRQQEAAQQYQQRVAEAADQQRRAEQAAAGRGFQPIRSVKDLILDGKDLAARNAKIQIVGFYRKIGDAEFLYTSQMDAYQSDDNFIPILTDDAQRDLRESLLGFVCSQAEAGCQIDVGGHMTMCKNLSPLAANYPDKPCLNVEVEIVYRPGD